MANTYTIIQYTFIAIVFGVAVWYLFNMIKDSFSHKKSCGSDCGCSVKEEKSKS